VPPGPQFGAVVCRDARAHRTRGRARAQNLGYTLAISSGIATALHSSHSLCYIRDFVRSSVNGWSVRFLKRHSLLAIRSASRRCGALQHFAALSAVLRGLAAARNGLAFNLSNHGHFRRILVTFTEY
jgi:hypothetical protein